jgi:hypothetical protein
MMQNTFSRDFRQVDEAAAEQDRAYRENVRLFAEMFLILGPDCLKLGGTRHDAEPSGGQGGGRGQVGAAPQP